MKFKHKTNVTVDLKGSGHLHIFCTRIFVKPRTNPLVPDHYVFQLYDETVAEIPCGWVEEFSYFKSMFDTEKVYFSFISQEEN